MAARLPEGNSTGEGLHRRRMERWFIYYGTVQMMKHV